MLNPELVLKYGERSLLFFNKFVEGIGDDLAGRCYAMNYSTPIDSAELVAPDTIGVVTDDDNELYIAKHIGFEVSFKLREQYDERDPAVLCIKQSESKAKEGGIPIWVG